MAFRFEIDEEVDVLLPVILDDDGDVVAVDHVEYESSDEGVVTFVAGPDPLLGGVAISTGVIGQATLMATVFAADGGFGEYVGEVALGLGVPVGGELAFGTPRKRTI